MAYKKAAMKKKRIYRKKKGVVRRAVRKARKSMFAKRVKTVVNRMAETKRGYYDTDSEVAFAGGMPLCNTQSNEHSLCIKELNPGDGTTTHSTLVIGQGDGQAQRTGNVITTCGGMLRGVVRINTAWNTTTNYNPCPVHVCLWIVSMKKHFTDQLSTLNTIISNSFFEYGNLSQGFDGSMNDLVKVPNSATVTVYKKRVFKLGAASYYSGTGSSAPNNNQQRYENNDAVMSQMFRINLSKILPKNYRFNDGSDVMTNQRRRWLFFTVHRVDNTIPITDGSSTNGPRPAFVHYAFDYRFKDI